ncbi:hypothetical protein [Fulvivirga ligni]|uniref:hypothetical protein n=1 Tax=Fulvivirga ligni TaxID=2904246 RepID=UPI001F26B446|nr:hypothetical protein [Fulvivirga ligni]UII21608.1 hypothetical protein LVD16_27655 [Fulvivirga ligni]
MHFSTAGSIEFSDFESDEDVNYIVSYWYKLGSSISVTGGSELNTTPGLNGWLCATALVDNPTSLIINVGAGSDIDNVRAYPEQAQMVTYTHYPGVGISSVSDQNNMTSYYKYDAFDRLISIFDSKGNMLKSYEYYYKNKP